MRVRFISASCRARARLSASPGSPSTIRTLGGPWTMVKALAWLFCSGCRRPGRSQPGSDGSRARRADPRQRAGLRFQPAPGWNPPPGGPPASGSRRVFEDAQGSPQRAVLCRLAVRVKSWPWRTWRAHPATRAILPLRPGAAKGQVEHLHLAGSGQLGCSMALPRFWRPSESNTSRLAPSAGRMAWASCRALAMSVRVVTGTEVRAARRFSSEARRSTRASWP